MTEIDANLGAAFARRFRIVRRLGAGGMGTVFLAEQIGVGNHPVALKVLNRKLLDDPEFLLRFQNEAASTGRIRHPNVVTIYESGQGDDGTPYIAMEYLEGETLRHALTTRGALPVAECAEILQQTARGLNAAHKLGIIHRDLKPDNIFLTYSEDLVEEGSALPGGGRGALRAPAVLVGEGSALPRVRSLDSDGVHRTPEIGEPGGLPYQVKLVDFGIAKLRESATHTLTGTVLGTPAYMSYEQASGMKSDELDARSDIYSLGVVTYEMLTGRVPFHSDTPLGYLGKHLHDAPPPFRAVNPDLPALPEVQSVVMKALTKDRNQRYGSALRFTKEFASAVYSTGQPAATPPLATTRVISLTMPSQGTSRFFAPSEPPPANPAPQTEAHWAGVTSPPSGSSQPMPQPQPVDTRAPGAVVPSIVLKPSPVRDTSQFPSVMKYLAFGALMVLIVAGAFWYFSQPSGRPQPREGSQLKEKPITGPATKPDEALVRGYSGIPVTTKPRIPSAAVSESALDADTEAAIRSLLKTWVETFRGRDANAQADCYAPLVQTYFRSHNFSNDQVRRDKERVFLSLADVRKYEITDVKIFPDINGRYIATFKKTWDTIRTNGRPFSGEETQRLTFERFGSDWRIVGEEETNILHLVR